MSAAVALTLCRQGSEVKYRKECGFRLLDDFYITF